jgi:hypothetical protein
MTMLDPKKRYCSALKKDGSECRGWPDSTGLCPAHRPNAHEIHVLGGKSKTKHHQLETRLNPRLRPVLDLLARAIVETHDGTLQPAKAQAIASLASSLVKVTEFAELEVRLTSIEVRLKKGSRAWD